MAKKHTPAEVKTADAPARSDLDIILDAPELKEPAGQPTPEAPAAPSIEDEIEAAEARLKELKATAKQAKKTAGGGRGVAPGRTRQFLAGVIIKRHGLAAGVTGEMVAELNAEAGKPNDVESRGCLTRAWHSLNGFLNPDDPAAGLKTEQGQQA